jgi:hypothetical protein
MSDERISALERLIESRREDRDKQIGDLAVDIAGNEKELAAISHRIAALEGIKPPTALSYWGPAAATVGLAITVGGAFLTMMQRESEARELVVASKYQSNLDKIEALRFDMRFLDSELRKQDQDFRGGLSAVEARQLMLEKQVQDMDLIGSRRWVKR